MNDEEIIELYFERQERAITETEAKYGRYCRTIADNILHSRQDTEECLNDTWLRTWNSIPPARPSVFSAFLAKITRSLAINRINRENAKKRNRAVTVALEELSECVCTADTEKEFNAKELERAVNTFVFQLNARERNIFIRRYFFVEPVSVIAGKYGLKEGNIMTILSRTRKKLKTYLVKEGFICE